MASTKVVKVKLVSTEKTGHFYTTTINTSNMNMKEGNKKKLELKKYDPVVRKHVVYKQEKMK